MVDTISYLINVTQCIYYHVTIEAAWVSRIGTLSTVLTIGLTENKNESNGY